MNHISTYSQAAQDLFVETVLKGKLNGYFLEIGSNHPSIHNNTYLLEKKYNWKGLMVEYDKTFEPLYKKDRPTFSKIIHGLKKPRKRISRFGIYHS
jgi:hypothetical protein